MATYKATNSAAFKMPKFVPAIWSSRIQKNIHDKQVLAPLFTREYEGEIKGAGDVVKVHGVGNVAVQDYVVGTDIDYDTLTDAELLIEVDAAKYFAFSVEDIEVAQANPKYVAEASAEAAMGMAKATDNYLYNKLYVSAVNDTADDWGQRGATSATNGGLMTCDATSSVETVYNSLVDAGVRLDDLLCPDDGRFFIIPSFAKGSILKDPRFVANNSAGQAQARDKGVIGTIAGFEIISMPKSTFTRWDTANANATGDLGVGTGTTADDYNGIFGRKGALAFVEQLSKVENMRLEKRFADAVRGLHLFGSGPLRPQFVGAMTFDNPNVTDA